MLMPSRKSRSWLLTARRSSSSTLLAFRAPLRSLARRPITVSTRAALLSSLARVARYSFTLAMPASTVSSQPSLVRLPRVRVMAPSSVLKVSLRRSSFTRNSSFFILMMASNSVKTSCLTRIISAERAWSFFTLLLTVASTICLYASRSASTRAFSAFSSASSWAFSSARCSGVSFVMSIFLNG